MLKSEFQHQFWVTKKAVQRKLGSKEDENIVASDGELDSKIELFRSVAESCSKLYRIIDQYQERVCILAQEENSLGKFLREVSKESPTTGKMMSTTGKAVSYCGQQRISIRVPLLRLHHDVHTFKGRAIADTHHTIQLMEKERTEYRAALSWMKSVSIQLDPDTGRGLEKFRKAQRHVKSAKTKFDKYTLDCLEKIDLLAAARCNMFSHALVGYQNAILQFAKKTDETYKNTLKNLAKDPHYSFSILKELTQANPNAEEEREGDAPGEAVETQPGELPADDDQMLFFKDDYKDDVGTTVASEKENVLKDVALEIDALLSGVPDLTIGAADPALASKTQDTTTAATDLLGLNLDDEFSDFMSAPAPFLPSALLTNCILTDEGGFDFGASLSEPAADPLQPLHDPETNGGKSSEKASDIFSSLLQSFSKQGGTDSSAAGTVKQSKPTGSNKTAGKDLSGWYQLFAELDPLSNPDAIPSKSDAPNNSMAA
ncbi:islet cell autoantigen 1 [Anopheles stephensi]|uniref:islet cell autoantigen 1 n=1 Tax=Anopheles stephensi TaxID=30069 RepID=UPI0016588816|nr:islet cell autoantigen 1 [Anopheles stephensi]XP_035917055.1 islet cell autoantigen 1 [Anopheles stephensi]